MAYQKKIKVELTKENFISIVKECETKSDFITKYPTLYRQLNKKEFKKEIMNMLPRKIKWTNEKLIEEAKKYKTRNEWMKENISSYNTVLKRQGLYDICVQHMPYEKLKYTYDICKNTYEKFTKVRDLYNTHPGVYSAAIRNGWHKDLIKKMIKYPPNETKWTFEKVKSEALKYNSIKEFKNGSRGAYFKAVYSKWISNIIGHMTGGYTKWTEEKLLDVLRKYKPNEWYKIPECKAPIAYIKRHNLEKYILNKLN